MDAKLKREIAVIGHAHSGKTSVVESLLFVSGATTRKGDVMKGNSVSDFNEDEIERKITINDHFLKTVYKGFQIQLIDTPGYADFIGETISALSVVDGAVVVLDCVNGVEVGTEMLWDRLESAKIPRIIFLNKTDKPDADVARTLNGIIEHLSRKAVMVDLKSAEFMETVAETDDRLIEKYLDSGSLTLEELTTALRKAVLKAEIFPIVCGSALTDQGIRDLLEYVIAYFPSPLDHPAFHGRDAVTKELRDIQPQEDGPFVGYIFKSMFDPHLGHLALMRILRGKLTNNSDFINVNTSTKEHIGSVSMLQGKEQQTISEAGCGDIVALTKLKNSHVCDCLTDEKEKLVLDPIIFPEPSISASIKPKTRADEEKISASLNRLCEEDHTFRVSRDNETNELIIAGVGDLHLKVILERMRRRYHVDVELGKPKVAYRESITKKARARHKYKKQSGGRGQYADVELEVSPLPPGGPQVEFVNKIFGGAIPRNFIPSVEKGVRQAISEGVLAGYPLINIQVMVVDGSYHDVDSSDMAFQIAGALALKEAVRQASVVLLEPVMEADIAVPDDFIGQISGDINSRRGKIIGAEAKGKCQTLKAHVPCSEMFTYATDLRSMTGGRGSYAMAFSHYEQAPTKITSQIISQKQNTHEANGKTG